jgi:hypothetical protein
VEREKTGAAGVTDSTASVQGAGAGSTPSAALHSIQVQPIPVTVAKKLLVRKHYLRSMPGGTQLAFGVFSDQRLLGALTFGSGPAFAYRLVKDASADDCLTLSRLWLSDALPKNSESRVIGIVLRYLRENTSLKFLVSYADPSQGHSGTIYQATGWLYTGLSSAMPRYDLGDGKARHSRSVSHAYGSYSVRYFASHGVAVKVLPQVAKHRYIYFLNNDWRSRLNVPVLPYPKREV